MDRLLKVLKRLFDMLVGRSKLLDGPKAQGLDDSQQPRQNSSTNQFMLFSNGSDVRKNSLWLSLIYVFSDMM